MVGDHSSQRAGKWVSGREAAHPSWHARAGGPFVVGRPRGDSVHLGEMSSSHQAPADSSVSRDPTTNAGKHSRPSATSSMAGPEIGQTPARDCPETGPSDPSSARNGIWTKASRVQAVWSLSLTELRARYLAGCTGRGVWVDWWGSGASWLRRGVPWCASRCHDAGSKPAKNRPGLHWAAAATGTHNHDAAAGPGHAEMPGQTRWDAPNPVLHEVFLPANMAPPPSARCLGPPPNHTSQMSR
jgi:hypothetical protein